MSDASQALLARVRSSTSVLLTGPEGPDGDSIGACLALQRLLGVVAPGVRVTVSGSAGHRYAFLPGAESMVADHRVEPADGVIVLDGDRKRLPVPVAAVFDQARWTGIVDHHRSTEPSLYDVAVFDATAESTCGMVAGLANDWGVPIDRPLAELIYAGIIFDTGGFRYSNTHASTHTLAAELLATGIDHAKIMLRVLVERRAPALRLLASILVDAEIIGGGRLALGRCSRALMARLDANETDLDGVVDLLQHIEGVELAVVVVERSSERAKLSLRSRGSIDVAALARSFDEGGGGHAKAAGVVLHGPWESTVVEVRRRLLDAVSPEGS